jgi:hypothetical protein
MERLGKQHRYQASNILPVLRTKAEAREEGSVLQARRGEKAKLFGLPNEIVIAVKI